MKRILVVMSITLLHVSCAKKEEPIQQPVSKYCNGRIAVIYERPLRDYGGFQIQFQAPSDLAAEAYERKLGKDYAEKYDLSLWIIRKGRLSNNYDCRYVTDLIPQAQLDKYGVPQHQQRLNLHKVE